MDVNNYLLFKQGLIPKSELIKNSIGGKRLLESIDPSKIEVQDDIKGFSNTENDPFAELREIERKCPSTKKVREFIKKNVKKINDTYDF